jgi:hypothetical protein
MKSQSRNGDVYDRKPFKDTNKFARYEGELYVVYSFGQHWPMFIYDPAAGQWFENEDRFSRTTSKHHTQCYPIGALAPETTKLSCYGMKQLVRDGAFSDLPF